MSEARLTVTRPPFGFGTLIPESLRMAWRLKALWIFGVFLSGETGGSIQEIFDLEDWDDGPYVGGWDILPEVELAVAILIVSGFLIFLLAMFALYLISEGGVIQAGAAYAFSFLFDLTGSKQLVCRGDELVNGLTGFADQGRHLLPEGVRLIDIELLRVLRQVDFAECSHHHARGIAEGAKARTGLHRYELKRLQQRRRWLSGGSHGLASGNST